MIARIADLRNRRDSKGFTLIELLVVIIILGVLAAVVVFAVRGTGDKGQSAALKTDEKTFRTAEEAYCAKFGSYGTEDQLVAQKFLSEKSAYTDVALNNSGPCKGNGTTNSGYSLTSATTATVEIAANADQWQVSDTGSGAGYSSSAFVYPLNSNLNEPLIILNRDYTLRGGLAASWERIPQGTNRNTVNGVGPGPAVLPSTPTPYPTCSGVADRPYCADTWRFHLRQGVKFHDGAPFDADDVIWTWRDRQTVSGSPSSGQNTLGNTRTPSNVTTVSNPCTTSLQVCPWDSVERIDQFTVDITPRIQNLRFPEQVLHPKGAIVPVLRDGSGNPVQAPPAEQTPGLSSPRSLGRHLDGSTGGIPANSKALGAGNTVITVASTSPPTPGTPVGTGPFKYVSYTFTSPQGGGKASFVTNQDYWGADKPAVAGMNYTFIADPAVRTAGLQSGQYDLAIDLDPLAVSTVEGSGRRVVNAPYGRNSLIYVNKVIKIATGTLDATKIPAGIPANYTFNLGTDREIREAASLAIDRNAYRTAIYAGNAEVGRWMGPPNILGTFQNVVPPMVTDTAAASTTLDTAGWTCQNAAPGLGTACAANEIRKYNGATTAVSVDTTSGSATVTNASPSFGPGDVGMTLQGPGITPGSLIVSQTGSSAVLSLPATATATGVAASVSKFHTGRQLDLWMVGLSLVPQSAYDLLAAQMKLAGINLITRRGTCDASVTCPDGSPGRGFMYNSSLWDFDLELPNQNDGNAAFLPVLRMACPTATNLRFSPADGTNGRGPAVTDTPNGGGVYPFGNTPCTSPGAVLGPFDTFVSNSNNATTQADNQSAAADMMRILVGQNETNIVIPIVGEWRIYGMSSTVNLTDPHPSQTSQRWTSLTKTA